MLTRLSTRNRLTLQGGPPCVVLRSYTVAELDALADRAGFEDRWVVKEPF